MSEFKRQHPVAAISRVIDVIKQNFITILIVLFIGTSNSEGYFLYFILGGLAVALIGGVFGWWVFRYRVYEDEFQIIKGVIVKNKVYMSKDRIQVIDITEGLLQRMFGLVQVEVKTAGGGTETATISAISREEAEALRKELRNKNRDDSPAGNDAEESEIEEEEVILKSWKLSKKDLVAAAFTSGNFGLIASILGAISGQLDEFINEETIDYVYELLPGYSNVSLIIALVLTIVIISWTLSFLGVIFNYSDFKLEKTSKELIITTGLIERKHITVPFDRIQATRFVEGVIRQPFGYGMVYVESAGFNQTQQGRSIVIAPYISATYVQQFLNDFIGIEHQPIKKMRPAKRALFRYIRRPAYFLIVAVPFLWYLLDYGWLSISLIPLMAYLGWLRYKDAFASFDQNLLKMRYRILSRTTAFIKRNRIQHVQLTQNPFQVRKDLQSLNAMAASGAGGMNFEIPDIDHEDAFKVYQWVINGISDTENEMENDHLKNTAEQ
ncbi:MAG: PH domain-containing protein [Gracilimonas sp.]|nr:PH domain-containing protein [Gracilimonas sp.]